MFTEEIRDKYLNHYAKSSVYDTALLHELFDKYITLFTAFNILYGIVPAMLKKNGLVLCAPETDNKMATELVCQYLSEQRLMVDFEAQNAEDVKSLIDVLENNIFNIKLDKSGNSIPELDQQILDGLKSDNHLDRCHSILKTIYLVRCNMVHGHKDLQEYQRLLLEPLSRLLITLNDCLFAELDQHTVPATKPIN